MNFICSQVENMSISINYYEFIRQMYETLTKYIKAYKSETNDYYKKLSKLHEKYFPKLSGMKDELKKISNIKKNHIISLSSKVPKILSQQITNLKYFIAGVDTTIKSFEKTLKEKNSMSSKYQSDYEESRNNLLKKYKEIEKSKNLYFTNASQTEDLIHKYYLGKSSLQTEITNTTDQMTPIPAVPIVTDAQIENSIKQTKKNENEYLNLVKSAKSLENRFFELSDTSKDNMKRISCEIITKMKDNVVDFLLLLKNCFKLPLSEIDTYLPELIKLDENKKIEHIINSTYKKEHSLIPIFAEKYELKSIKQKSGSLDEDENDCVMIEEDEILSTIKKMEENFDLIEKNTIEQINNQVKLRCRELTFKLLSFSPKILEEIDKKNIICDTKVENENNINNENNNNNNNNIINDEKEKEKEKEEEKEKEKEKEKENEKDIVKEKNYSITEEEIEELKKLLEDKGNRFVFLRKINTFRKYGKFEIPEREFSIICDLFNKIADCIKKDNDLHSMRSILILSQTYYKLENDKKIYIQHKIKNNKLFKDKLLWEEFVSSLILKEVQKHLNNDIKDPNFVDSHKTLESEKYEMIIFSQLLPLVKNMIDFELDDNSIKSIAQTLVSYYKIKEESAKTIYDMIENKGIDQKTKEKYNLDLTIIKEGEENEEEDISTSKNEEKNEKKEEGEGDGDNDEENITEKIVTEVTHTLADDEDINDKMIKDNDDDEDDLNDKMIKDLDDDEDVDMDMENNEEEEKENKDEKDGEDTKKKEENNKKDE